MSVRSGFRHGLPGWPSEVTIVGLTVLLVTSIVVCVGLGPVWIPPGIVASILKSGVIVPDTQNWTPAQEGIVLGLRLPRVLLGCLVGGGLATVGCVLQAITRNPLADPYLFGVSSGAGLGAVLVLLYTGSFLGPATLQMAAFAGALAAMFLVFVLAKETAGFAIQRLVLTGVAVHFVLSALMNGLIMAGPERGAETALFWMLGGFGAARWDTIAPAAIAVGAGGFWVLHRARFLDALSIGEEAAHTLGVPVARLRMEMFVVTALMTGVLVAASGSVGFIGLVVPHCARWLGGGRLRRVTPLAALMGAVFAIWADVGARMAFAPREIPLGVITAAVGGFFFLTVLRRRRL